MTKHDFELVFSDNIFDVRGVCRACGHHSHVYTVPALFSGTEREIQDAICDRELQWGATYTDGGSCSGVKK
jgi:hypothetical protein